MQEPEPWHPPRQTIGYVSYVLYGRPISDDSFVGRLMALIPHADRINREILRLAFPIHIGAWEAWMAAEDGVGWEEGYRGVLDGASGTRAPERVG